MQVSEELRSARDLLVLGEFFKVLKIPDKSQKKSQNTTKSRAPLRLFGNLLELTWQFFLVDFYKSPRFLFALHGPSPGYKF